MASASAPDFRRHLILLGVLALPSLTASCAPQQLSQVADAAPPTVDILEPADGAVVESATPRIDVGYADDASGISVLSFRATINGSDYSADFDHDSRGAQGEVSSARPLPLGENLLVVEVSDRAGNSSRAEATFINAGGGWLEALVAPGQEPRRSVELILDASGSMQEALGTTTRMAVAKEAVATLVTGMPAAMPLGLRVFRDCSEIEALMPVAPVDQQSFLASVASVEPAGGTPLVASLMQSFDTLSAADGERVAVLVTDGGESCDGSFEEARNRASDAGVRVVIIGFDIADEALNQVLRELAESTGGAFFDARDPVALSEALERGVLRLRYQVLDGTGTPVADGEVGGAPVELPLGTYSVRVDGTPALFVDSVTIGALTHTSLILRDTASGLVAEVEESAR